MSTSVRLSTKRDRVDTRCIPGFLDSPPEDNSYYARAQSQTMEFEDVEVGGSFTTAGRTVTEADIVNFAGVSGDFYYPHTDEERMKETGFGGRIAHGALVFSVMTGLVWQADADRSDVVALYGIDGMRLTAPVHPGDTVTV